MAGAGAAQGAPGPELPGAAGAAKVAGLEVRVAALKAEGVRLRAAAKAAAKAAARNDQEVADAERQLAVQRARLDPNWRDWAGLPEVLLVKVAGTLVAQTEAGWAGWLKESAWSEKLRKFGKDEEEVELLMAKRKRDGNCLFVFARVCKPWRKAQLKVGGRLRTRVLSDVIMPGSVALAKWVLVEGCPRERFGLSNMAISAARHGNLDLIKWLCGEGGFAMDELVMQNAAIGGNLELVRWLRGEGCPWDWLTCYQAVEQGHVEVLRWTRANGCPWIAQTRDKAVAELGYTDDFGNLVDYLGNPVQ